MSPAGLWLLRFLIAGIGAAIVTMVLIYIGRTKGAERSRREAIMFGIVGAIFLVLGFFSAIAVKLIPELEKAGILLVAVGVAFLLFGATCLVFREVYKTICEIQEKSTDESPSDKV